jgi:hypothetical protein
MPKTKKTETQKLDVDDTILIDGCFTVDKTRWGTWRSYDADGKEIITALTEEQCVFSTRWYMKALQEGFTDDAPTYDSVVGGKL